MPKAIVLCATPRGWRHSVLTVEGGMVCGGLSDVPPDAGPEEARAAAAAMLVGLARGFHGVGVDVTWDPPKKPGSGPGGSLPEWPHGMAVNP
ncbi:hypothetical protein ACFPM3_05855 [Streptomyces coeruleoprunus]|uniref:DUF429 domain-containing protein n=1 Tax=Streptomyces coeruleoprunus TaxID=285563 RepID=A0ABV9XB30_9ACTN